ncbi:MAG: hypothetical protein H7Z15_10120 [Rhizobacter sp.]|nr:hypothetical protein [Rhizobacter sp.]
MFDDLSAFDLVFIFGALAFGFGVVKFMMSVNKPPDPPHPSRPPDEPPSAPPAH